VTHVTLTTAWTSFLTMHCCDKSIRKPLLSESREKGNRNRFPKNNNKKYTADGVELDTFDGGGESDDNEVEVTCKFYSFQMVLQRILLLLWKNLLFRRRHYVVTALEVILPTLLAMLVAYLRTIVPEGITVDTTHNTTYPVVYEYVS